MPTNRRRSHCFCLFATLALACDTSSSVSTQRIVKPPPVASEPAKLPAGTYNLRGTPMQGRTRHIEINFDVEAAQLTAKAGPITLTGTMGMHVQNTDELEILDVDGGLVRYGRLSHLLDKTAITTRMNMPDGTVEAETEEDLGELHGRTELIEFTAGRWTRKLVGAAPSAELAAELQDAPIDDAIYPAAAKVGETWTLTGPALQRWMGSGMTATRGHFKSTLVSVEVLPTETIAVITSAGEVGGKMRDEDDREFDFTMRIETTERRSLERAMEIEASGKGSIEFSQTYVEDGLPVSLSVAGPLTLRVKGALR